MELKILRDEFKRASTVAAKIDVLHRVNKERRQHGHKNLSKGCRSFIIQTVTPVLNCLSNHFQNCPQDFETKWGTEFMKAATKFSSKHCKGKGSECKR